jgi:hypothetical protein
MLVKLRGALVDVLLGAALGLHAAPARAEGSASSYALQACALAYENSQEHRRAGALSVARSELARCAQDDCPEFIRTDCAQWSKEIEAEQPTVVFAAKRGRRNLEEVRVSIGDRALAAQLPSQAIELDPGSYDIQFETPGSSAVVQHAVIRAGEKNQLVQVEFTAAPEHPAGPAPTGGAPPATAEVRTELASPSAGPRALPWVLLGAGAASIGVGMGLALWGQSSENQLRSTCSPNCTNAEVRSVRTKYVLGDISVGVGLVSVSVGAYLLLSGRGSEHTAQLPVTVIADPSRVFAAYGARF